MIDINNESGLPVDEKHLVGLARFALAALRIHPDAELSIVMVDEDTMAAYNRKFMDEEGPTDVLSFPMDELRPSPTGGEPPLGVLGDIVLCPSVTERQAVEAGRSPIKEADYLLVHGILHLVGFDHAEPTEKALMFNLNDQIIRAWEKQRGSGNG
ncbi:MAG: rRNA maturation RNase YbeY [Propionibacteriaceae bacterium]|jgi:probable rRNA maturation factor|nr:rRNA maturation RNase YbeY [Propionibacteriaceae bacterium]